MVFVQLYGHVLANGSDPQRSGDAPLLVCRQGVKSFLERRPVLRRGLGFLELPQKVENLFLELAESLRPPEVEMGTFDTPPGEPTASASRIMMFRRGLFIARTA